MNNIAKASEGVAPELPQGYLSKTGNDLVVSLTDITGGQGRGEKVDVLPYIVVFRKWLKIHLGKDLDLNSAIAIHAKYLLSAKESKDEVAAAATAVFKGAKSGGNAGKVVFRVVAGLKTRSDFDKHIMTYGLFQAVLSVIFVLNDYEDSLPIPALGANITWEPENEDDDRLDCWWQFAHGGIHMVASLTARVDAIIKASEEEGHTIGADTLNLCKKLDKFLPTKNWFINMGFQLDLQAYRNAMIKYRNGDLKEEPELKSDTLRAIFAASGWDLEDAVVQKGWGWIEKGGVARSYGNKFLEMAKEHYLVQSSNKEEKVEVETKTKSKGKKGSKKSA